MPVYGLIAANDPASVFKGNRPGIRSLQPKSCRNDSARSGHGPEGSPFPSGEGQDDGKDEGEPAVQEAGVAGHQFWRRRIQGTVSIVFSDVPSKSFFRRWYSLRWASLRSVMARCRYRSVVAEEGTRPCVPLPPHPNPARLVRPQILKSENFPASRCPFRVKKPV